MEKKEKNTLPIQISITSIAFVLLLAHFFCPPITFDNSAIILFFIALIPWLFPLVKSLELPGGIKVEFHDQKKLEKEAKKKIQTEFEADPSSFEVGIPLDKPATLYWLSNDLMWIQDMTFRNKLPSRVLDGVNNSLTYIKSLGFEDKSFPVVELIHAKNILQAVDGYQPKTEKEQSIIDSHYKNVRQYVENVKWFFHRVLTLKEQNFNKLK